MDAAIVITSIFPPTEAIRRFAASPGYRLVVVGDRKTPADWASPDTTYLGIDAEIQTRSALGGLLPYNHYARKMLGYLHAVAHGATVIVDTDDDNIPKPSWSFPGFQGEFDVLPDGLGHVNVYQLYSDQPIWPRGLPLRLITTDFGLETKLARASARVGVWQGLADEDPDVDAIYRLTNDTPCFFRERSAPVVLGHGTFSPFNSQNTAVRAELFPLLYLPAFVTFRFTDILRGLVAQPIMWALGYRLGFVHATVRQVRNPHDYMKDFESEIPMYRHTEKVTELAMAAVRPDATVSANLHDVYASLERHGIVEAREMQLLERWLGVF